jgi:hypothetical protein
MQTSGSGGFTASEREAELRRRNEEIDARQSEALRVAQDVVRLQQAKLVLSPGGKRSPSRQVGSLPPPQPPQPPECVMTMDDGWAIPPLPCIRVPDRALISFLLFPPPSTGLLICRQFAGEAFGIICWRAVFGGQWAIPGQ